MHSWGGAVTDVDLSKILGGGHSKILGQAETDESTGVSESLSPLVK